MKFPRSSLILNDQDKVLINQSLSLFVSRKLQGARKLRRQSRIGVATGDRASAIRIRGVIQAKVPVRKHPTSRSLRVRCGSCTRAVQ